MQQKFTLFALAGLAALVKPSVAGYALEDDYSADNFFSMFNFFTDAGRSPSPLAITVALLITSKILPTARSSMCRSPRLSPAD